MDELDTEKAESMLADLEWVTRCVEENTELCARCAGGDESPVLKTCADARRDGGQETND